MEETNRAIFKVWSLLLDPALHHIPRRDRLTDQIPMAQLDAFGQPRSPRTINQHHETLFQLHSVRNRRPRQPIPIVDQIPPRLSILSYDAQRPFLLLAHKQYPSATAISPARVFGGFDRSLQGSLASNQDLASSALYLFAEFTSLENEY